MFHGRYPGYASGITEADYRQRPENRTQDVGRDKGRSMALGNDKAYVMGVNTGALQQIFIKIMVLAGPIWVDEQRFDSQNYFFGKYNENCNSRQICKGLWKISYFPRNLTKIRINIKITILHKKTISCCPHPSVIAASFQCFDMLIIKRMFYPLICPRFWLGNHPITGNIEASLQLQSVP